MSWQYWIAIVLVLAVLPKFLEVLVMSMCLGYYRAKIGFFQTITGIEKEKFALLHKTFKGDDDGKA